MISLFQTAAGSWHIPSILMATSWLIGTLVAGGFIVANLRVNRDDRIKAFQKEQQASVKIAELEAVARPKPFRERLIAQLNAISPTIIPALRSGQTNFTKDLLPHHFTDLLRLASEPESSAYISFRASGTLSVSSDIGQTNGAVFTLDPALLNE